MKEKLSLRIIIHLIEFGGSLGILYFLKKFLSESHHHELNTIMPILVDIAFLAVIASFGSKFAKMIGIAPMAGNIFLGIIAGPAIFNVLQPDALGVQLALLAGVLFILFEAGLHFDLEDLKKNLSIATKVALLGVAIPLGSFTLLGFYFFNLSLIQAIFLGGIFTATSVGLSVEALKRAGKLNTSLGNKIIGAAIIDDILGVVILSTLSKMAGGNFSIEGLLLLAFSIISFIVGTYALWSWGIADKIEKYIDSHYKNTTGVYTRFFFGSLIGAGALAGIIGLEPVLGAFGIGVVLSKIDNDVKNSTWEKIEAYMHIFAGGFLVSIGTLLPRSAVISGKVWLLAILFTIIGFAGKYVVKYLFSNKTEGKQVAYAMSIRGEVGLVFVAVAIANNILDETYASAALLGVIIVTVVGAILFEKSVTKEKNKQENSEPQYYADLSL